jgi:hypothetical protein
VRDVIEGETAVLDNDNVQEYLPPPPGMQPGPEQSINDKLTNQLQTRYDFYKTFADFPEITAPMIQGIMGLVHEKSPEYNLPDSLSYLEKKATADGDSLEDLWQLLTQEVFYTGSKVPRFICASTRRRAFETGDSRRSVKESRPKWSCWESTVWRLIRMMTSSTLRSCTIAS